MKTFKQIVNNKVLSLSESFGESNYQTTKDWIISLNLDGRTPKGMKKEVSILNFIKGQIKMADDFYKGIPTDSIKKTIQDSLDRFSSNELELINQKLRISDDEPKIIKKGIVKYIKSDASSYKKFTSAVKDVSAFLKELKGYHKKPLKDLVIRFVKKSDLTSKASYKSEKDELWINLQSMGKTTDSYGSLVYVVLHELGHRYLKSNPQDWNIDSILWITTKYSMTDSWSGEEKFAELFAITHWEKKYKEHKIKMDKFKNLIK